MTTQKSELTLWNLSESPVDQKIKVQEDIFDKDYGGGGERHSLLIHIHNCAQMI
jgi:hypothetical protein